MDKSESSPQEVVDVACHACRAINDSTVKRCWMCKATLAPQLSAKQPVTNDPQSIDQAVKVTMAVLFVVICAVGLGCVAVSPWLGAAYFMVVTPGFLGVLGAALFRKRSKEASTASAVVGFVVMVFVLIPVAAVILAVCIVLSMFAALQQICEQIVNAPP
jgi:lysylphosphatidylglycerol synthetase-like protein (DUF2156 family)